MSEVECPFCGEWIDVWVDADGARILEYIEDCSVCCRPIRFVAERVLGDEEYRVHAFRE